MFRIKENADGTMAVYSAEHHALLCVVNSQMSSAKENSGTQVAEEAKRHISSSSTVQFRNHDRKHARDHPTLNKYNNSRKLHSKARLWSGKHPSRSSNKVLQLEQYKETPPTTPPSSPEVIEILDDEPALPPEEPVPECTDVVSFCRMLGLIPIAEASVAGLKCHPRECATLESPFKDLPKRLWDFPYLRLTARSGSDGHSGSDTEGSFRPSHHDVVQVSRFSPLTAANCQTLVKKYERYCIMSALSLCRLSTRSLPFSTPHLRHKEEEENYRVTYRPPFPWGTFMHKYTFNRQQHEEKKTVLRTGLSKRARDLKRLCKECSVRVVYLSSKEIDRWSKLRISAARRQLPKHKTDDRDGCSSESVGALPDNAYRRFVIQSASKGGLCLKMKVLKSNKQAETKNREATQQRHRAAVTPWHSAFRKSLAECKVPVPDIKHSIVSKNNHLYVRGTEIQVRCEDFLWTDCNTKHTVDSLPKVPPTGVAPGVSVPLENGDDPTDDSSLPSPPTSVAVGRIRPRSGKPRDDGNAKQSTPCREPDDLSREGELGCADQWENTNLTVSNLPSGKRKRSAGEGEDRCKKPTVPVTRVSPVASPACTPSEAIAGQNRRSEVRRTLARSSFATNGHGSRPRGANRGGIAECIADSPWSRFSISKGKEASAHCPRALSPAESRGSNSQAQLPAGTGSVPCTAGIPIPSGEEYDDEVEVIEEMPVQKRWAFLCPLCNQSQAFPSQNQATENFHTHLVSYHRLANTCSISSTVPVMIQGSARNSGSQNGVVHPITDISVDRKFAASATGRTLSRRIPVPKDDRPLVPRKLSGSHF